MQLVLSLFPGIGLLDMAFEEALEMTYENIQADAARAIKGKRRPK